MSEYVFRCADSYGWKGWKPGAYERENDTDHYGTLHDEIVRCGDCQYYEDTGNCKWFVCSLCWMLAEVTPDGYCAWGERKEDGE